MKNQKLPGRGMVSIFAVLILLSGLLTGCPDSSGNLITVDSIFVKPPNQTALFLADGVEAVINLQGMMVNVNYSNGATEKVIIDNDTTIIKIEQSGDSFNATFDGITVIFKVTDDGFTISYSGMVLEVSGFDLSPGVKTITVKYLTLTSSFDFTIIGDEGDIAADIGYQEEPVFTDGGSIVKYPVKIKDSYSGQLTLKWFDEYGNELGRKDQVGEVSPEQDSEDELSITLAGSATAGKYYFELGYMTTVTPVETWVPISRRAELIISIKPDLEAALEGMLERLTVGKLCAKWFETQTAADAEGGDYLIELTNDGKLKTPALGDPDTAVGSWVVDVPNKRITITAIGAYAIFGSADINFNFVETTQIHVQSSSPITSLIGLSEKDLFKKAD